MIDRAIVFAESGDSGLPHDDSHDIFCCSKVMAPESLSEFRGG
jgi:hypothetical protein